MCASESGTLVSAAHGYRRDHHLLPSHRPRGRAALHALQPSRVRRLPDPGRGRSHCFECIRAARPPAKERMRRWNATAGPLVTKILIGINAAVYLLTSSSAGTETASRAVRPRRARRRPVPARHERVRALRDHAHRLQHGPAVSLRRSARIALGRWRYLLLSAPRCSAVRSAPLLLSPHVSPDGASGAVFGLMGAAASACASAASAGNEGGVGALIGSTSC